MDIKHQIIKATFFMSAACVAICILMACSMKESSEAEERAKIFAINYFNLKYNEAAKLATDEAKKWIEYRAANITQDDLDVLDSQPDTATCEINGFDSDGDFGTVKVTIKNFLLVDSIGKTGKMCGERDYAIKMKRVGETWLVDIDKPV